MSAVIVPQDLDAERTYTRVLQSLTGLQEAAGAIEQRVEECLSEEREVLRQLEAKLRAVQAKIDRLSRSDGKVLKASSLLRLPEMATECERRIATLFAESTQPPKVVLDSLTIHAPRDFRGQHTKELYAFFKQAQSQAQTPEDAEILGGDFTSPCSLVPFDTKPVHASSGHGETDSRDALSMQLSASSLAEQQLPENAHLAAQSLVAENIALMPQLEFPSSLLQDRVPGARCEDAGSQ